MIYEVAHQIALVPLALLLLRRRSVPRGFWFLAAAFGVSWSGDAIASYTGHGWDTIFLWVPLQVGLAIAAFRRQWLMPALIAGYAVAIAGLALGPPDVLVTTLGSIVICTLALRADALTVPALIYFGVGTACYFGMISHLDSGFMPWWYGYQGARLAAFGAFGVELVRQQRRRLAHVDNGGATGASSATAAPD